MKRNAGQSVCTKNENWRIGKLGTAAYRPLLSRGDRQKTCYLPRLTVLYFLLCQLAKYYSRV